ncbi:MAG: PTS sugar transporter subunit IIA [Deltaproteobacteria bacterium]|nr:MAG: PTS sugar transporter subunit IIA [Deltaproteobacteria bacterium]
MRLSEYMEPELVTVDMKADDGRQLVDELTRLICSQHDYIDRDLLANAFIERQHKGRAGLECGIAVYHALVRGLKRPVFAIARLADELDLGTLDGTPVRIVFALVSPEDSPATHVRLLARMARLFNRPKIQNRIRAAASRLELYNLLRKEDAGHV